MKTDDTYCWAYCSHGGVCEKEAGHEGLHDTRYCTWADAEALTKEAADQIFLQKGGEAAARILAVTDLLLGLANREDDE